jgi:putative oxidoreductase
MKKLFFDCGTRDLTASLGIFALRAMIGLMMLIGHGIPKIQNFAKYKDSFYVPDFFPFNHLSAQVSLIAAISAEVLCSALIVLGLATRPAAFVLGFNMVVAAFAFHAADPWFMGNGAAKEPALLYLIPLIAIILTGAGAISMDALICKDGKRRRW